MVAYPLLNPASIVLSKNTLDSWEWANDKAHRRKYEAVLEIHPKINYIVSIIWWTII